MRKFKLMMLCCIIAGSILLSGFTPSPKSGLHGNQTPGSWQEDTATINKLVRVGNYFISKKGLNIEKARISIDSATSYCSRKKLEQPSGLHLLSAQFYFITGDYSKSEEEAKEAIDLAERNRENDILVKSMLFIAKYYQRTGFYQESMNYLDRCINISEAEGIKGIIPQAYYAKANVLNSANDLKGYAKNLRLMIEAAKSEDDTVTTEEGLLRLGTLYDEKVRNFKLSDSILRECVKLSLAKKDSFYTGYASANLGWTYYLEKRYDSATNIYRRSLKYSLASKQIGTAANSLGNLGTIFRDLGDYTTALKYYKKSIDFAGKLKDFYTLSWVYNDMSKLYLEKGDTSNAFQSYVLYKTFNDTVLLKTSNQGLSDARIRYEADVHNKEITLLSLRLKNNRIITAGFAVFTLLLIAIGILVIRSSRIDSKRKISEMKHQISEITQANLRQQMNPHFIFNTLNSIQYYMYQNDKLATNNYLTKFSTLMRKILENSQHTSVPLRDELDALRLYLDLEKLRFKDKFDYHIEVDEEIDLLLFKVPTMLIQPYVENSICHGLLAKEDKGYVKIDLKLGTNHICCTIEDNGIGRDAAQERNKKKEANHNSLGTKIVSSRLDLVNALYGTSLKTAYTDLKDEEGKPAGTRVEIHIPIMT